MSFLDEVPQDWRAPELSHLRDLLVLAYRRPAPLQHLADAAGLVPGTFPIADDLRTTCTELIRTLGNQGKLRSLVLRAAADPAAVAYKDQFREMLGDDYRAAHPADAISDGPLDPVLLGDRQSERLMEKRSRLLGIELAAAVVTTAAGVARLTVHFDGPRGNGTGFLIAPDLLLTSRHNVRHEVHGCAIEVIAEFDYDRTARPHPLICPVLAAPVADDPANDWAVLRLGHPVHRTPLRLGSHFPPSVEDLLVIIQHPLGGHKQFALEPLAVTGVGATSLQYIADTQAGSSGSPVCNERMEVIALHRGEREVTVVAAGQPQTIWRNEGVPIDLVLRDLDRLGIAYSSGK